MRMPRDPFERGSGAGEFLGFLLVALISAGAFFYVSSDHRQSLARVVSMEGSGGIAAVADEPAIDATITASVPLPTSRPD